MNIVVLAGGLSPERDVSLVSGSLIANALTENGHKVLLCDVYRGIEDISDIPSLFTNKNDFSYKIENTEPDLEAVKASNGGREALIGENVLEVCAFADVVFLALHGAMGENGALQATLDNYGITNYTGSGYAGSLLAMDKSLSKKLMTLDTIPNAEWIIYDIDNDTPERVEDTVGYPCVVKPASCGSSVGVSIVENEAELTDALKYARKYENKIVIEKKINGREFSVAVLDGKALPPIEIIPVNGWYDYKNKYQGLTKEVTPAELTEKQTERISELAIRVHNCLSLGDYSRVDFLLDSDIDEFLCLEANTLPGMTPTSLMPQEAQAAGISYNELCEKIVSMAYMKGKKK
ncbi:MAG: D-alanine--D-alanine ligase [Clostridia bacterium]|nr:D-alanine--D-alanine ligase [Clostridia bacterium]